MRKLFASLRATPAWVKGLALLCVILLIGAGVFWDEEVGRLYNGGPHHSGAGPSSSGAAPATAGLLSWYPMEEAAPNAPRADAHGTTNYGNVLVAANGAAAGLIGNAMELGDGDLRTTNATPTFPLDVRQDFTIVTWAYTPSAASGDVYLWRTGGGAANVRIQVRPDDSDYVAIVDEEARTQYVTNTDFAPDTWQMVTLRHEAATNTVRLRVNMNADVSDTLSTPLAGPSANEARIEGSGSPARLDEQSVWQAYLSEAELAWLYNGGAGRAYVEVGGEDSSSSGSAAGTAPATAGLLAWHPMEEAGATATRTDAHSSVDLEVAEGKPVGGGAVPGVQGQAVDLGPEGRLDTKNSAPAFPLDLSEDFSVVSWVYVPAAETETGMIWAAENGAFPLRLKTVPWKERYAFIFHAGSADSTAEEGKVETEQDDLARVQNNGLVRDTWQMVTLRYDASARTVRLRVDGGPDAEEALSAPINLGDGDHWWWLNAGGLRVDEQSVWQAYLTDEEVAWLYNGGAGRTYGDL